MSTTSTAKGIPAALSDKLRDFLAMAKTGNVIMDIKEGRILSWKFTEYGRVNDPPDHQLTKG